jgi:flagellar biogenesis protein FliO
MSYQPDLIMSAVKLLGVLAIMLGGLIGLVYWFRKKINLPMGASDKTAISVIAHHYLGAKKAISLVQVPGKVLVLGITAEHIRLLDKIDPDLIPADKPLPADVSKNIPFSEHLSRWSTKMTGRRES